MHILVCMHNTIIFNFPVLPHDKQLCKKYIWKDFSRIEDKHYLAQEYSKQVTHKPLSLRFYYRGERIVSTKYSSLQLMSLKIIKIVIVHPILYKF